MIAVLRFLVLAAVLVFVAVEIASVPGSISGTVGTVRFETSLPVAIGLLLLLLVVFVVAARLLATLFRLPGRFGVARELRRRRKGEAALTASLLALASGETADARREATRARRLLGRTPQTLLAAAEADRAAGRLDGAETGYKALADRTDTRFLGLRGLIGLAIAKGDASGAASLFAQADQARPGTSWIRTERYALACRSSDWVTAFDLAPPGAEQASLAAAAAVALEPTDPARARKLAHDAHRASPGLVPAALVLARRLRDAGKETRALAVLRETWAHTPHPDLADLALAPVTDRIKRVQAAEQFVARSASLLESHLLLGRVCLDAAMWGEARRHGADAKAAGPADRRVLLLLGDIAERDGSLSEPERRASQADAMRTAAASPMPAWICARCTAEQVAWRPVCPHCQSVGTIGWALPPLVARPSAGPGPASLSLVPTDAPLLLGPAALPAASGPDVA